MAVLAVMLAAMRLRRGVVTMPLAVAVMGVGRLVMLSIMPAVAWLRFGPMATLLVAVAVVCVGSMAVLAVMLAAMRLRFGPMVVAGTMLFPGVFVGNVAMLAFTARAMGLGCGVVMVAVALVRRAWHEGAHIHRRGRRLNRIRVSLGGLHYKVEPFLLLRHQVGVEATRRHQFGVVARFHQPPVVQHQNAMGIDHAGEAVSDSQGGPPLNQPVEGLHNERLVLGINVGEGLVQYQDGRVFEQGAGDGDALLLPA